jgi:hypothetical protein
MTQFVAQRLGSDELEQNITFNENTTLRYIRLMLMKYGDVQGDIKVTLYKNTDVVATATITESQINSNVTGTYAYGFFRFDFLRGINVASGDYKLGLQGLGDYLTTWSSSKYWAWIQEHENKIVDTIGTINSDGNQPRSFRLYSLGRP